MADGNPEPAHWTQFYHNTTSVAVDGGRAAKSPRKRHRGSRRAPTTLLNTNTSNFRAMVQQFTGVPSAPYIPGGSSTISFGFGFDNPNQRTTADLPDFGHHEQQLDINRSPQKPQENMGFQMNYENIENESPHGMNYARTAGRPPELLEGLFLDGITGGMPPAIEYGHRDGSTSTYN